MPVRASGDRLAWFRTGHGVFGELFRVLDLYYPPGKFCSITILDEDIRRFGGKLLSQDHKAVQELTTARILHEVGPDPHPFNE